MTFRAFLGKDNFKEIKKYINKYPKDGSVSFTIKSNKLHATFGIWGYVNFNAMKLGDKIKGKFNVPVDTVKTTIVIG